MTATTATKKIKAPAFFQITRDTLLAAISKVLPVVPSVTTLDILKTLKLEVRDEGDARLLELTATNGALSVITRVPVTEGTVGVQLVPAKAFATLISTMPAGGLTLRATANQLTVQGGEAVVNLFTKPVDEFPAVTAQLATMAPVAVLPAITLHSVAEQVRYAVSTEESRPILNGVLLSFQQDTLRGVATNGHRLALVDLRRDGTTDASVTDLLVTSALLDAARRAITGDDTLTVRASATAVHLASATSEVIGSLIEGPYPNYEAVIPREYTLAATANRADLLATLTRLALVSNAESGALSLTFDSEAGTLRFHGASAVTGTGTDVVSMQGEGSLTIGVNVGYLMEAVKSIPTEQVRIFGTVAERPLKLEPTPLPGTMTRCEMLVMPLRLDAQRVNG